MTLTGGEVGWRKCRNSLLPAGCREHGFYPLSGKIPSAARQLSPCAPTGESPQATTKTQHSQKYVKIIKENKIILKQNIFKKRLKALKWRRRGRRKEERGRRKSR